MRKEKRFLIKKSCEKIKLFFVQCLIGYSGLSVTFGIVGLINLVTGNTIKDTSFDLSVMVLIGISFIMSILFQFGTLHVLVKFDTGITTTESWSENYLTFIGAIGVVSVALNVQADTGNIGIILAWTIISASSIVLGYKMFNFFDKKTNDKENSR